MPRRRSSTKDVTEQAKELAKFVEYLNESDDVTVLYVIEAYRSANLQEIADNGHDTFRFYSYSGSHNRLDVNKLLVHLVSEEVLEVRYNTNTGDPVIDFLTAYVTINPRHDLMHCHYRDFCGVEQYYRDEFDYSVEIRIPRAQAETWDSPLWSSSPTSSSTSATVTVEQNPKLALIRQQCRDALLKEFLKLTVQRKTKLSCIENLPAIKSMSDVLPKTKDELMKIKNVTEANFVEFGECLLKITKKYRDEADKLTSPAPSEKDSSVFHMEDSDLDMKSGQNSLDAKRKSSSGDDGNRADKVIKPPSDSDSSVFDFDSDSDSEMKSGQNSNDAKRKSSCGDEGDTKRLKKV